MHHKNIKAIVRKQLKVNYHHWNRLNKKTKKRIAKKVLEEIKRDYSFDDEIKISEAELLGIENQLPTPGIMNLEDMERFINSHKNDVLLKLKRHKKHPTYLKDEELRFIDDILDDQIINKLLSYDGYSPVMRDLFPSNYLRAELLKSIKYPEISYRKFCGDDKSYKGHKANSGYIGMENKQNRAFIGLPVNKKKMISHVQMSQFRSSLSFKQLVNLTVYILHHFKDAGFLDGGIIHCVDSTELAVDRQELLATVTIKGKKIRVYDDIDCDCGKRRTKRDKSIYAVGYRLHTLTAINADTGQSFPLISLLAPANHHDSNFLKYLVQFGKAIGLELRLITADEAYHDNEDVIYTESDVHLIRPPGSKVSLPENVDKDTLQVTCNDFCEIPMEYSGIGEEGHEYKCKAVFGECPHTAMCPGYRSIPIDNGYFQRILHGDDQVIKALEIRKNGERPFNLIKKREGLETVRVRSQQGLIVRSAFTTIATLLLEMAGTRKKKKQNQTSFLNAA
jgi:hypothetical protein